MSNDEIRTCISVMERKGEKGTPHRSLHDPAPDVRCSEWVIHAAFAMRASRPLFPQSLLYCCNARTVEKGNSRHRLVL